MKTITRNLEYVLYERIRDALLAEIPFAVTCQYSKRLKLGVFQFVDSGYIPKCLRDDSLNIKGNQEKVDRLNDNVARIIRNREDELKGFKKLMKQ